MGREEGGGFRMGTRVYLWRIHFDIWQNQYNIVKSKKKNKTSSNIRKVTVHILLKSGLENFEHYFTSMQLCGSLSILSHCLSLGSE